MARGSGGRIGHRTTLKDKYALGTEGELKARTETGYQPEATHFQQIAPTDHGGNANEPNRGGKNSRSGDFKFTSAP